jgi:hypothetical protein
MEEKIYNLSSNILSAFFLHASHLHIFSSDCHIYAMEALLDYIQYMYKNRK